MSAPDRFQIQSRRSEQGEIVTSFGVDPLTGLPVLIYTFPGRPTVDEGVLESENIPGILAAGSSTGDTGRSEGYVVVAYSGDYDGIAPGESVVGAAFAAEAARALRDAAEAAVVHGDIRPDRFLLADDHVLVEGYGVPWSAADPEFAAPEYGGRGSYAADVYAFARSLLHLGGGQLPAATADALQGALAADPEARPSAEALHAALRRARDAAPPPTAPRPGGTLGAITLDFDDHGEDNGEDHRDDPDPAAIALGTPSRGDDTEGEGGDDAPYAAPERGSEGGASEAIDFDFDFDFSGFDDEPKPEDPADAGAARAPDSPARGGPAFGPSGPGSDDGGRPRDPAPIEIETDPGEDPVRVGPPPDTRRDGPARDRGFVKDLPPGATYRSGDLESAAPPAAFTFDEEEESGSNRRRWGRFVMLALVLVGAITLGVLLRPGGADVAGPTTQPIYYTVDIGVEPASVPRVDLIAVTSPPGSEFGPGDVLDSVPGQVLLDAEGRWVLRGRYEGRLTEPVELVVPEVRRAVLVVPAAPSGESSAP